MLPLHIIVQVSHHNWALAGYAILHWILSTLSCSLALNCVSSTSFLITSTTAAPICCSISSSHFSSALSISSRYFSFLTCSPLCSILLGPACHHYFRFPSASSFPIYPNFLHLIRPSSQPQSLYGTQTVTGTSCMLTLPYIVRLFHFYVFLFHP